MTLLELYNYLVNYRFGGTDVLIIFLYFIAYISNYEFEQKLFCYVLLTMFLFFRVFFIIYTSDRLDKKCNYLK